MIRWMEMKMINENMMDDMKMKMNGNMNDTWNELMMNWVDGWIF